jgi:hypothetical protein
LLADALKVNTVVTTIALGGNGIGANGAVELAGALKLNTSVTAISIAGNEIGDEGASALADALKVNKTVLHVDLDINGISDEGAMALANALEVNTTLRDLNMSGNSIGDKGASALIGALQVNVYVTYINIGLFCNNVDKLIARNVRLRHLFLSDARQELLSVLCADECGVVWPYLLDAADALTGVGITPCMVERLRAEFAAVVEERRRREQPVIVADVCQLQRSIDVQSNQIDFLKFFASKKASQNAEQTNQIAELASQNAEQTIHIALQTYQIAEQTNKIAAMQHSADMIVEQNQHMQRQMNALLMSLSREQGRSDNDDERDTRAVKRRRTGR